jgi:hypothetical protein
MAARDFLLQEILVARKVFVLEIIFANKIFLLFLFFDYGKFSGILSPKYLVYFERNRH